MKTVLITGCSSGIGLLTACSFANKGYKVYAGVRNIKEIENNNLKKLQKVNIKLIELDVTNEIIIKKTVSDIVNNEGKIDILVNNAGFGFLGPVEAFTLDEIKDQFDTNVWGMFRVIKEIIPVMRSIRNGTIIIVSSINGLVAFPLWGIYSSSKFAIESMTEALRFEMESFGIRVALVEPGSFRTDFSKNRKMPESLNSSNSPYKLTTNNFFIKFNAMEASANKSKLLQSLFNPQKVADKIVRIAEQSSPKLHNKIGIDAYAYSWAKRWFPDSLWQLILRKAYR